MNNGQPPVFKTINEVIAFMLAFFAQFIGLLALLAIVQAVGGGAAWLGKLASGYSGKLSEGIKGNANDPDSLRNIARKNVNSARIASQAQTFRKYNDVSKQGGVRGWAAGRVARAAASGNILAKEANLNKTAKERIYSTKDNGDDTLLNARTATKDADGVYRTLDGKEVSDTERALANKFYKTMPELQSIEAYRETKTLSNEDSENYIRRFGQLAEQEKWSPEETTSQWMGTAFARQDERGELKHGKWEHDATTGKYSFKAAGSSGTFFSTPATGDLKKGESKTDSFVNETYYKKGSYKGANMLSSHPRALLKAKQEYVKRLNDPSADVHTKANADARLRQILEIEEAFKSPMQNPDYKGAATPGVQPYLDRMAGANAGTIAAFNELTAYNTTAGATVPGGPPPADAGGHIARLQTEIKDPAMSHETLRESDREKLAAAKAAGYTGPDPYIP